MKIKARIDFPKFMGYFGEMNGGKTLTEIEIDDIELGKIFGELLMKSQDTMSDESKMIFVVDNYWKMRRIST